MKHIPNILSGFRIVLIPFFVMLAQREQYFAAAIVLVISGITDFLDGYLARRFQWISQLGKVLDPAADKLTLIAVALLFITKFSQYRIFFIVLILKEVIMLAVSGYFIKTGVKVNGAKWFGKVVTALFYVTTVSVMLIPSMPEGLRTGLIALTTVCAVAALFMYIPEFRQLLNAKNKS